MKLSVTSGSALRVFNACARRNGSLRVAGYPHAVPRSQGRITLCPVARTNYLQSERLTSPMLKRSYSGCACASASSRKATRTAYIALGSNLGDRIAEIEKACNEMDRRGIRVKRTSSLWETEPMYYADQDRFINGACEVSICPPSGPGLAHEISGKPHM
jgi:hypothetical protein